MSDLSPEIWDEIEKKSFLAGDPERRWIALGTLRTIIRKARRTSPQNALLWALYADALRLGGETLGGWDKDDLHEYMLGEWSGWSKHTALGRTRLKPNRRSSRLSKAEFAEFVDFVVRRFAGYGIVLELPGDVAA